VTAPLPTITREIPLPSPVQPDERMRQFAHSLCECGYDLAACATRLGVFPRLGVSFWPAMRHNWTARADDAVDRLIALFMDGEPAKADAIASLFSSAFVDTAIEMRLLEHDSGTLRPNMCLFPCYGKYLATDFAPRNTAINQVMWLWGESFLLGGLVKRTPRRRAIDLGTGSGIHAILATDHCERVVGADVNPRALAFSQFNAALNGATNIDFVHSDLFDSIEGTCDLLVANPPYAPDGAAKPGDNFWSGGERGTDLLCRIVEAIPTRLDRDGTAHVISLYPNPPQTTIRDHFERWLGGSLGEWDVLDHTWPVPRYEDLLSQQPFQGDKSAWRFGVVSLRRSPTGEGWWRQAASKVSSFFGPDGRCIVTADHDAV
jgi:Methyltransferase small domain